MKRSLRYFDLPCWTLMASIVLAAAGCGISIGDACERSADCVTAAASWFCTTTQVGGYCTMEGCGQKSCPSEAICIAFFPRQFIARIACDPDREDALDHSLPPTDDCKAGEICLRSGYCALPRQAKRFCMKKCETDDDCREEYACLATGTLGAEVIIDREESRSMEHRYCRQADRSPIQP